MNSTTKKSRRMERIIHSSFLKRAKRSENSNFIYIVYPKVKKKKHKLTCQMRQRLAERCIRFSGWHSTVDASKWYTVSWRLSITKHTYVYKSQWVKQTDRFVWLPVEYTTMRGFYLFQRLIYIFIVIQIFFW